MLSLTVDDLESAWLHVEENAGCSGVDGVTVSRFAYQAPEALKQLALEAQTGAYHPLPLIEMRMEKKAGGKETRRLLVPAVSDRVLQTAVLRQIAGPLERDFADTS